MPSFTTVYRVIVMVAAGVIVVKGWELYGPSAEQAKSFGSRAYELAHSAWRDLRPGDSPSPAGSNDPRLTIALPVATAPASTIEPAPLFADPTSGDGAGNVTTSGPEDIKQAAATESAPVEAASAEADERLPALYTRLEELGARDGELTPWGSSGQMYRFACRASMADASSLARHFEAVAAEPCSAVEQVVAKVEAWRAAQRDMVLR